MSEELARWAPGVSLEWALVSLVFGIILLAIIVIRLWLEFRRADDKEARSERGPEATRQGQDEMETSEQRQAE